MSAMAPVSFGPLFATAYQVPSGFVWPEAMDVETRAVLIELYEELAARANAFNTTQRMLLGYSYCGGSSSISASPLKEDMDKALAVLREARDEVVEKMRLMRLMGYLPLPPPHKDLDDFTSKALNLPPCRNAALKPYDPAEAVAARAREEAAAALRLEEAAEARHRERDAVEAHRRDLQAAAARRREEKAAAARRREAKGAAGRRRDAKAAAEAEVRRLQGQRAPSTLLQPHRHGQEQLQEEGPSRLQQEARRLQGQRAPSTLLQPHRHEMPSQEEHIPLQEEGPSRLQQLLQSQRARREEIERLRKSIIKMNVKLQKMEEEEEREKMEEEEEREKMEAAAKEKMEKLEARLDILREASRRLDAVGGGM